MVENNYLVRVPLLDPKQNAIGYKLVWQKNSESRTDCQLLNLLSFVADHTASAKLGVLFLNAGPALFSSTALNTLIPAHTVLILNSADLADAYYVVMATKLRRRGFGLALRDASFEFLENDELLLPLFTHVTIGADYSDPATIVSLLKSKKITLTVVMERFSNWEDFNAYSLKGMSGFFKDLCQTPRPLNSDPAQKLSWQAILLLQLMQLVQDNADIHHLEKLLKQDETISDRLLGHLNSATFGLGGHIASVRQAVTMLGYNPLFRWLALLLATTCKPGFCPALLQSAIIRARFIELLGQGVLPKGKADNLFIVGIFSLLDQLLEISVDEIFSHVTLSEDIVQVLRSQDGVYAPYLALAVACEREDANAAAIANAMGMNTTRINQAHLAAIAWAQAIKL